MIPTLREIRGGASPSKFGWGQSRDIFRGGPVKKITLYDGLIAAIGVQHRQVPNLGVSWSCFLAVTLMMV